MTVQHPDPERLTLAALPAEPADLDVLGHLAGCDECREQVAALRRTVELGRAGRSDPAAPPPRVWQAIVDELDEGGDLPAVEQRPVVRARKGWRAVAVPVAAALIGVAAGLGIAFGVGPALSPSAGGGAGPVAQLAPVGPADPRATGTVGAVRRDGTRELVVRLEGVTNTDGGDYLEAWLMDAAGTRLVSLGPLAPDGGPGGGGSYRGEFTVPADLPTTEFGTVDISAEKWDGDPTHSRISLLRGPLV